MPSEGPARRGPLAGIRVVAFSGIGPGPFAAMLLADMGADVVRVDSVVPPAVKTIVPILGTKFDVLARGQRSIILDLKKPEAVAIALALAERSDILLEGFRPGVMERLGLGPEACMARNRALVYGRVTGWGQTGPLAAAAGHDINYIGLSGVLHSIGRDGEAPMFPLGLAGDYGGGGMLLTVGVLAALHERHASGSGQVIDASMTEGSALLLASHYGMFAGGMLPGRRGTHLFDGGPHFYETYRCADGRHVCVGALEPAFYAKLLELCGLDAARLPGQFDPGAWPEMKRRFAALFGTRTRDEWVDLLGGSDTCFAPVLDLAEAPQHPHARARGSFACVDGVVQPSPAPRFSRTPAAAPASGSQPGADSVRVLEELGLDPARIGQLVASHAVVASCATVDSAPARGQY